MYNAEMKNSFLNTVVNENTYKVYVRIFTSAESIEKLFEKDICKMSVEEISTFLELKTGTRTTNTVQTISMLRNYVDWCLRNGKISGENNFEKIDFHKIDKSKEIRRSYLKNEQEFEDICSIVYAQNAFYNETVEVQKELVVRLCFLEISRDEIILIRKDQVDYNRGVIYSPLYPEIEYPVSKKILDLCKYCEEQKTILHGEDAKIKGEEPLCNNDYLLRARISALRGKDESSPVSRERVQRFVKEFFTAYYEETEIYKSCTSKRLAESHMLMRIHESESPIQYIETIIKEEITLRKPDIKETTLNSRMRQIKKLYETWSKVFY